MDGSVFIETIEADLRTELSRLGSSKSLYADTRGDMEPEPVLDAAAANATQTVDILEEWTSESDLAVFERAADREQAHLDAIVDELGTELSDDGPAAAEALDDASGDAARLGALVGWTLVTERKSTQSSGFFTGQAKPGTASTFRSFGDDYDDTRGEALDALEEVCESDEQWDAAIDAATAVISAAYDAYFETLEELGMNPKPVC